MLMCVAGTRIRVRSRCRPMGRTIEAAIPLISSRRPPKTMGVHRRVEHATGANAPFEAGAPNNRAVARASGGPSHAQA